MECPLFSIIFVMCVLKVSSMALQGPSSLQYDPCGLGIINFQKILTNKFWQASVNLGLYSELSEADIEIDFFNPVGFTWISQNSSLILQENSTYIRLKPLGKLPKLYKFYITVEGNHTAPIVKKFSLNNQTLCDDEERRHLNLSSLFNNTCGRRSLEFTELTTYDTKAKDGEWPWHVAITIRDASLHNSLRYHCGGSIISKNAVLTAGHCVTRQGIYTEAKMIVVIAGTSTIVSSEVQEPQTQTFDAIQVIIHPSYTDPLATADLAIIKIPQPGFVYNDFVQPICLWGPVYDKVKMVGRHAIVVGFGQTENGTSDGELRTARTLIQSDETCIDFDSNVYKSLMNEFTLCAGFGPQSGANPRNGDSGGGLILPVQEKDHKVHFYIQGVLSKCGMPGGVTVCDPKFYVVYTNVGPHHPWIVHNM